MLNQQMGEYSILNRFYFRWIAVIGIGLILGVVSIRFSGFYALSLIAGIVLVTICTTRPEIVLLFWLVFTSSIIASNQIPSFSIGFGTLYITDLFMFFLFGLIVVRALVEPDFKLVGTPLDLPILLFVGIWMVSGFIAIYQGRVPFNRTLGEIRGILSYLTFFCVTNLMRQKKQLVLLRRGLIVIGGFVALAMIAQYSLGTSWMFVAGRVEDMAGSEGASNVDVIRIIPPGQSLLVVGLMLLMVTLLLSTNRRYVVDMRRLLLSGLLILGVMLTFFRASWIMIAMSFIFVAFHAWKQNKQRVLRLSISAIVFLIFILLVLQLGSNSQWSRISLAFTQRLTTIFEDETYQSSDSSLRWRDFEYELAIPQFLSHPILGLGPGAYYRPFVAGKDYVGNVMRNWMHNGHLWILVKSGLVGYIVMVWISVTFLKRGLSLWQKAPDAGMRSTALAFTLTYAGALLVSIVEPYLVSDNWTIVIGIMMGMNESIFKLADRENISMTEIDGAKANA